MGYRMKVNSISRLRFGLPEIIYVYLALLPIIWMTEKSIQMVVQLLVCSVFVLIKKAKLKKCIISLMIYIFAHLVSIILNFQNESDPNRIMAAFSTVMSWAIGALIFSYIGDIKIRKETIQRLCSYLLYVIIIISSLALIFSKLGISPFHIAGRSLYMIEWFNGRNRMRSTCFMDYANLVPYACLLLFPFAYDRIDKDRTTLRIGFLLLMIIPLYVSNSRIGMLLFGGLLVIEAYKALRKRKNSRLILIMVIVLLVVIVAINYQKILDLVTSGIDSIFYGRGASNATRFKQYGITLERYKESTIVFGVGIKSMSPAVPDIPLGSHSTYLGALYKSGLIGFFAMIYFFAYLIRRFFVLCKMRCLDKSYLISLLGFLIMMILEDIDGENWAIFLFFLCMAFAINMGKQEESECREG